MVSGMDMVRSRIDLRSTARGAFDYLMAHASAAGFKLVPRTARLIRSIEFQDADRVSNPFSAQAASGHVNFYLRRPILRDLPSLFDAAVERFGQVRANGLGEYRLRLRSHDEAAELLAFLRDQEAWPRHRHASRFTSETLGIVTARQVLSAAMRLAADVEMHPFGPSTDYDVVFDGQLLPPKAIFGIAAGEALGFPLKPENFRGGEGTQCFRMLRDFGYEIVRKGDLLSLPPDGMSAIDRTWAEGSPTLVIHLRRERGTGLAAAKRDSFRAEHGRLRCERCGMDPVEVYGQAAGEACIEVHHRQVHLSDMQPGHLTSLADLQCLCANCHRVAHREMKSLVAST